MFRIKYLAILLGFILIIPGFYLSSSSGLSKDFNIIDVDLPSDSTGNGTIAVRIYEPVNGIRYKDGASIIIYVPGADTTGGLGNTFPATNIIIIHFLFPGGFDPLSGRSSNGVYDHRGLNCIKALRDVILYAAGKLTDSRGYRIDDVLSIPILHDNIGLIGLSNGGNIVISVAALYGDELEGYLRYIIQWESPVSSQIATVDLGPIRHNCSPNNFVNPRYLGYNPMVLPVDYHDLRYNKNSMASVFHDGNNDSCYTTVIDPRTGLPTPDLNLNGILELDEDFPLSAYTDGEKDVYSRPVTHALLENNVFNDSWPEDIATVEEADRYWDLREAVYLYSDAIRNIPDLKGMILTSVKDHVQSAPDKPHIHQAFDGWNSNNVWVKINPDPKYMVEVDHSLIGRSDLPSNRHNIPPDNWLIYNYCIPEDIPDRIYQLAAILEMSDRVYYNRWSNIDISDIESGFGVTITIRNIGDKDIVVPWRVNIEDGFILTSRHFEGILSIPFGREESIVIHSFGFGSIKMRIIADDINISQDFLLIGFIFI